ncbi:hypothetical protein C8E95_2393 [Pseudonocardia autotrophica]|uniref:Uncharacterized protein n=2 Tax=Pseudonocardia TaxID=1847 RepID=A0A1Y2N978_PSEAH|nr:hypothetical protein BG845_00655 [Pseudonocardia autotrophica]TDN73302.1 hypothetical protein C8E95_2393 [Pseudonocardia autotrophica]BBG04038.1 hypothetical protein Pdca_52470 [Pseudonocardia autotrophica]GEC29401.1 hypothetical protein PSA01_64300 [Pseudonocardia saturnea]
MWFTLERMYGNEVSWCRCPGCGTEAELPAVETVGIAVPCPDCTDPMVPEWTWESAA